MAPGPSPAWKRAFDTVDRTVLTRVDAFARSEDFAALAALSRRAQREVRSRSERASRRVLHLLNLPAGSDVNRLLYQIAMLEREVRDLRKELGDAKGGEVTSPAAASRPRRRTGQSSA